MSLRRAAMAAAALLAGAAGTQAQVYRCGPAGSAVFSDRPCPEAGEKLKVSEPGATGRIEFEVPTIHYEVHAKRLVGVVQAMRTQNPGGFWGWAGWNVDYQLQHDRRGDACTMTSVTVRVRGKITMPRWVDEPQATLAEQTEWRRMYADLKRHEDGHIQHGREFALLLRERLLGMGTQACDGLEARARQEYHRLHENLKRRDADYDRRTDHGLRQDNPR